MLIAAMGLRIAAARDALWIDEIWSVEIAHSVSSPLALIRDARHDNNHLLNSAYLLLLDPTASPWVHRSLSLLASLGSLVLIVVIGRERSRAEALIGLLLFGFGYAFVLYGSEARGYGQVIFFALLAYWAMRRHLAEPRGWSAAIFSVCGVLGPLAHLTYVHFSLGAFLWSGCIWWRSDSARTQMLRELVRCHGAPALTAAALYFFFVRDMGVAGGPDYSASYAVARAAALLGGLPPSSEWMIPALVLVIAVTGLGVAELARRNPREALGLAMLGIVAPVLVVALLEPPLIYPRYFLVSLVFVLLIWIKLLSAWYDEGAIKRATAVAGIALGVGLHLPYDAQLVLHGRNSFDAAVSGFIRQSLVLGSPVSVPRIGIEQNPVTAALLRSRARRRQDGGGVEFSPIGEIPEGGAEGLLILGLESTDASPGEFRDRHGNRYRLERIHPVARESGFPVLVYRRAPQAD